MRHIEHVVLDTLIQYPNLWPEHGCYLTTDDFTGDCKEIFAVIRKRCIQSLPVDTKLVWEDLPTEIQLSGELEMLGGCAQRHTLGDYTQELKSHRATREAKEIGIALMESGDIAAARIALDNFKAGRSGYSRPEDSSKRLIEQIEYKTANPDAGLKTGLTQLDSIISLEPADLCVIAARPGMGKTALMLNIARRSGVPVGIFSLEMSNPQLMARLVAMEGVNYGRLKNPQRMQDNDWPGFTKATQGCVEQGIYINDTGGLSINALESDAHKMVREEGVKLLCVDYLQLVTCKTESRFNEVSEVSRRLKALAKNLEVPVIALSQLNRRTDTGGKPRPQMADLRESGQIEQDADQIVFIFRPEVYVEGERPGEAELIVAKNRAGETGSAWTGWQGAYQRFVDLYQYRKAA